MPLPAAMSFHSDPAAADAKMASFLGMKVKRRLRCGVVDGHGGKGAKVVVVWLWTFGNDVGGGDLVVGPK